MLSIRNVPNSHRDLYDAFCREFAAHRDLLLLQPAGPETLVRFLYFATADGGADIPRSGLSLARAQRAGGGPSLLLYGRARAPDLDALGNRVQELALQRTTWDGVTAVYLPRPAAGIGDGVADSMEAAALLADGTIVPRPAGEMYAIERGAFGAFLGDVERPGASARVFGFFKNGAHARTYSDSGEFRAHVWEPRGEAHAVA